MAYFGRSFLMYLNHFMITHTHKICINCEHINYNVLLYYILMMKLDGLIYGPNKDLVAWPFLRRGKINVLKQLSRVIIKEHDVMQGVPMPVSIDPLLDPDRYINHPFVQIKNIRVFFTDIKGSWKLEKTKEHTDAIDS